MKRHRRFVLISGNGAVAKHDEADRLTVGINAKGKRRSSRRKGRIGFHDAFRVGGYEILLLRQNLQFQ